MSQVIDAQTWQYPDIIRCVHCHVLIGVEASKPAPKECPACHKFKIVSALAGTEAKSE